MPEVETESTIKRSVAVPVFLVILALAALFVLVIAFISMNPPGFGNNEGIIHDIEKWPLPIAQLYRKHEIPDDAITVYGLNRFIDQRSITRIEGYPQIISDLVDGEGLEQTDSTHPLADQLQQLVPDAWGEPNLKHAEWYASPNFGVEHMEGRDLFLIVWDPGTNQVLILHNNIF